MSIDSFTKDIQKLFSFIFKKTKGKHKIKIFTRIKKHVKR
jgi:hypothetical protein